MTTPAVPIGSVSAEQAAHHGSGVAELDRVLGGGLVPGAAVLLAGEPGVGKSTLLLEVAARTAERGARTLYVTGEESASQVRLRADRTDAVHDQLYLAAETDLGAILTHIEEVRPRLVVVDSVQTIGAAGVDGVPGGVTQVKEVAAALVRVAKTRGVTVVLVGHVTKDGSIAGPRVLEHIVDVVLHFEGESGSRFRMVRAIKNRFGPVDEVGCFDLGPDGITAVTDPTGIFVERHHGRVAGTCVAVTMEGRRPLLAEVQSLVAEQTQDRPRRTTSGVDRLPARHGAGRAPPALRHRARLARRVRRRPSAAPSSPSPRPTSRSPSRWPPSHFLSPAPAGVVAMGEIGLSGELRRVRDVPLRLAEAARLGFELAIVPAEVGSSGRRREVDGMRVVEVADVRAALRFLDLNRALRVVEGG